VTTVNESQGKVTGRDKGDGSLDGGNRGYQKKSHGIVRLLGTNWGKSEGGGTILSQISKKTGHARAGRRPSTSPRGEEAS